MALVMIGAITQEDSSGWYAIIAPVIGVVIGVYTNSRSKVKRGGASSVDVDLSGIARLIDDLAGTLAAADDMETQEYPAVEIVETD